MSHSPIHLTTKREASHQSSEPGEEEEEESDFIPVIVIHGGASASSTCVEDYRSALHDVLSSGKQMLADGATCVEIASECVRLLEEIPFFNAGRGAVFNCEGDHELDASVMRGSDLSSGSVCAVKTLRNPILAAKSLLEKGNTVMLAGEGAEKYAKKKECCEIVQNDFFDTEARKSQYESTADLSITVAVEEHTEEEQQQQQQNQNSARELQLPSSARASTTTAPSSSRDLPQQQQQQPSSARQQQEQEQEQQQQQQYYETGSSPVPQLPVHHQHQPPSPASVPSSSRQLYQQQQQQQQQTSNNNHHWRQQIQNGPKSELFTFSLQPTSQQPSQPTSTLTSARSGVAGTNNNNKTYIPRQHPQNLSIVQQQMLYQQQQQNQNNNSASTPKNKNEEAILKLEAWQTHQHNQHVQLNDHEMRKLELESGHHHSQRTLQETPLSSRVLQRPQSGAAASSKRIGTASGGSVLIDHNSSNNNNNNNLPSPIRASDELSRIHQHQQEHNDTACLWRGCLDDGEEKYQGFCHEHAIKFQQWKLDHQQQQQQQQQQNQQIQQEPSPRSQFLQQQQQQIDKRERSAEMSSSGGSIRSGRGGNNNNNNSPTTNSKNASVIRPLSAKELAAPMTLPPGTENVILSASATTSTSTAAAAAGESSNSSPLQKQDTQPEMVSSARRGSSLTSSPTSGRGNNLNNNSNNSNNNKGPESTGTVGCVVLDLHGNLASATSTGGLTNKPQGRVADTGVIGAGTYAHDSYAAVSCAGSGEILIRISAAYSVVARMRFGHEAFFSACDQVVFEDLAGLGGVGGLISVDCSGNVAMPFSSTAMPRGFVQLKGTPCVAVVREPLKTLEELKTEKEQLQNSGLPVLNSANTSARLGAAAGNNNNNATSSAPVTTTTTPSASAAVASAAAARGGGNSAR